MAVAKKIPVFVWFVVASIFHRSVGLLQRLLAFLLKQPDNLFFRVFFFSFGFRGPEAANSCRTQHDQNKKRPIPGRRSILDFRFPQSSSTFSKSFFHFPRFLPPCLSYCYFLPFVTLVWIADSLLPGSSLSRTPETKLWVT